MAISKQNKAISWGRHLEWSVYKSGMWPVMICRLLCKEPELETQERSFFFLSRSHAHMHAHTYPSNVGECESRF